MAVLQQSLCDVCFHYVLFVCREGLQECRFVSFICHTVLLSFGFICDVLLLT